jgi:hypothetical protein
MMMFAAQIAFILSYLMKYVFGGDTA